MMRRRLVLSLPVLLACALTITAQGPSASLQTGVPVEKTFSTGETHSYTIKLEKEQFAQLTIEQRGIDVVVRVFLPDGSLLKEVDTPTGNDGSEYVEIVAEASGTYRIEVTQLAEGDNASKGSYEIKIAELRKATEQELQTRRNESTRKSKGRALLIETAENLSQLRLPETRVAMQIRAAELLWLTDEKRASSLMTQAVDDVRQIISDINAREDADFESVELAMKLRRRIVRALAPHDPEAALKFLQSTRIATGSTNQYGQMDPELQLEFQLVNQIVATDPKRAFEMGEDLLKRNSSSMLIEVLTRLVSKDRELAARLARDMAKKLVRQDLLQTRDSAYLAASLLQVVRTTGATMKQDGNGSSPDRLLSQEEFGELFQKIIAEVLSYSPPTSFYTPEADVARSLASVLRLMSNETKIYAANRAEAIEKKVNELLGTPDQLSTEWQRYMTAANTGSVDSALESVTQAPAPIRDMLYQQIASRIAMSGDVARARQVISERMTNPSQRQTALYALQQQEVTHAAEKGRFDEAFRLLSKFRPGDERNGLISQVLENLDNQSVKKSLAVQYLEQARNLVCSSARAENQEQMQNLLSIARTLARYDVNRAFETVAPLLDQFNEITAAAVTMNGFDQDYYHDGELIRSNGNSLAAAADQLGDTFATLAMFDFDRAKRAAEGINRTDIRLRTFLLIAERTMEVAIEPDEPEGYNSN